MSNELDIETYFTVCKECGHSTSMHVGLVDMGGGHSEVMGCMHNAGDDLCQCMKDYEEYDE